MRLKLTLKRIKYLKFEKPYDKKPIDAPGPGRHRNMNSLDYLADNNASFHAKNGDVFAAVHEADVGAKFLAGGVDGRLENEQLVIGLLLGGGGCGERVGESHVVGLADELLHGGVADGACEAEERPRIVLGERGSDGWRGRGAADVALAEVVHAELGLLNVRLQLAGLDLAAEDGVAVPQVLRARDHEHGLDLLQLRRAAGAARADDEAGEARFQAETQERLQRVKIACDREDGVCSDLQVGAQLQPAVQPARIEQPQRKQLRALREHPHLVGARQVAPELRRVLLHTELPLDLRGVVILVAILQRRLLVQALLVARALERLVALVVGAVDRVALAVPNRF